MANIPLRLVTGSGLLCGAVGVSGIGGLLKGKPQKPPQTSR
jgi:hypothetical protein